MNSDLTVEGHGLYFRKLLQGLIWPKHCVVIQDYGLICPGWADPSLDWAIKVAMKTAGKGVNMMALILMLGKGSGQILMRLTPKP